MKDFLPNWSRFFGWVLKKLKNGGSRVTKKINGKKTSYSEFFLNILAKINKLYFLVHKWIILIFFIKFEIALKTAKVLNAWSSTSVVSSIFKSYFLKWVPINVCFLFSSVQFLIINYLHLHTHILYISSHRNLYPILQRPHSTSHTPYPALLIPHTMSNTPLHNSHSIYPTLHIFHTEHTMLHIPYSTYHTPHSTLHILHSKLANPNTPLAPNINYSSPQWNYSVNTYIKLYTLNLKLFLVSFHELYLIFRSSPW